MSSSYKTLNVSTSADGYVVTVELNRPEALNAMNTAMGEDLLRCFEDLHRSPTVRAVVFTGAGTKAFCVGGDLKEREGMTDETWHAQHVIFEAAAARVLHCPVPVIAAVEGFAMGGGCELAVLSDFVVCGETAVFAVPEVTRGIFPGIGGTQLLPRILGAPMAKEMIFTGRRVDAREAKAIGLVNHVVPAGQARAKALEKHGHHRRPSGRRPRVQREAQTQVSGEVAKTPLTLPSPLKGRGRENWTYPLPSGERAG